MCVMSSCMHRLGLCNSIESVRGRRLTWSDGKNQAFVIPAISESAEQPDTAGVRNKAR